VYSWDARTSLAYVLQSWVHILVNIRHKSSCAVIDPVLVLTRLKKKKKWKKNGCFFFFFIFVFCVQHTKTLGPKSPSNYDSWKVIIYIGWKSRVDSYSFYSGCKKVKKLLNMCRLLLFSLFLDFLYTLCYVQETCCVLFVVTGRFVCLRKPLRFSVKRRVFF